MIKKIITILILFVSAPSAFATVSNNTSPFIFFSIINKTHFPVALTITDTRGIWKHFVANNIPFVLMPNARYENKLSEEKNVTETFVSTEIAQINNERENYLIFAESGMNHTISAHIFDGLGKIFVGSVTNHCAEKTPQGNTKCELIIQE